MKNRLWLFFLVLIGMMTSGLKGARRGYQWTLDRAQMDRSRRMRRSLPVRRPVKQYPSRPSLSQWTQQVVEPEEVMSTVEGP